ncbi:globin domain-containing protein [Shimia abyssi]|uniref:Hemoglobin-like flavoprotein n=1 Tax=Shimia abyssi TaxID=1662395 RepID=A0A2P8FA98_9RHOB|nr:globin domain-containing protein [Shimia abyssi]PSL18657.1 hemoglobin-like flavoprotein [Shimia abyssi]
MVPVNDRLSQESFQQAFAQKARIAARFYERLFEQTPELQSLFHNDQRHQQEMFASLLVTVMRTFDKPDALIAMAQRLSRAHKGYGVTPEQYAKAEGALIGALRDVLQEKFTPTVEEAWRRAIQVLITCMADRGAD